MTIAIIFAIVTFIMGFFELYDWVDGFFSFIGTLLWHLLLTVIMFLFGCLIAAGIGLCMPKHWEETTINLASLKDATGIEGNFVLGCGNIQTEQYYMYYENVGPMKYRPGKVEVGSNTLIVEDSTLTNTGLLVINKSKMNNRSLSRWLVIDVSIWHDQYEFTIPVGSLKQDFKL